MCTSCASGTKLIVVSSSSAYCVQSCLNGYKLANSGSSICISNCSTNTYFINFIENSAKTACVSACGAGIYKFIYIEFR